MPAGAPSSAGEVSLASGSEERQSAQDAPGTAEGHSVAEGTGLAQEPRAGIAALVATALQSGRSGNAAYQVYRQVTPEEAARATRGRGDCGFCAWIG